MRKKKKKKKERKIYNKKKLINFLRDSTLVNEFVINKWPAYLFQRVQLILERKNRKMYGISGILQLHLHFIAQCNVSELGSKDRTNQNGYYYPIMRDVLFSLFFSLSLPSLFLPPCLFSSPRYPGMVECGPFVHVFFLLCRIVDEMSSVAVTM